MAFTWGQFCRKYSRYLSEIWVWKLLIWYYSHISLGPISKCFLGKFSRSSVNGRAPPWCLLCLNELLGPRWPAPSPCKQCVQGMYMVATGLWHRQSYARLAGRHWSAITTMGALGSTTGECWKGYTSVKGGRPKDCIRHPHFEWWCVRVEFNLKSLMAKYLKKMNLWSALCLFNT